MEGAIPPQPITENTLSYGDMAKEAVSAGFYHSPGWNQDYPCIQVLTIDALLHDAEIKMPPQFGTFRHEQRVNQVPEAQSALDI